HNGQTENQSTLQGLVWRLVHGIYPDPKAKIPKLSIEEVTVLNEAIPSGTDGSINLTVRGGKPPYTYLWNNGPTNQDPNNLKPGTYWVILTDARDNSTLKTFILPEPLCPISITGTVTDATANGLANGKIDITISSAQGAVSYFWSNGDTTEDLCNLSAGI